MIRLAEARDSEALVQFCGDSLLGTYVLSRFGAYGNDYSFARCYVDRVEDRVLTTLSVLEDSAVLLTSERTDYDELSLVLPMLSVRILMTDVKAAERLSYPVADKKQAFCFVGDAAPVTAAGDAPLREVYMLISRSIPGSFPEDREAYLRFLSDFTFRRSRGFARLKAILTEGSVSACALTAAECAASAVISGVACDAVCRGRGYGKKVVSALVCDLQKENKKVHLIALNDTAVAFYRRIGFRESELITWLKVSRN